ncbi:MAG: argininosuccinate lyase [Chthonomonadales bacterium]
MTSSHQPDEPTRLWGGRFSAPPHEAVDRLNSSLRFDARLWPYDIQASIAHARMLGRQGILTSEEAEALAEGLRLLAEDLAAGKAQFPPDAEDVHTAIEVLLRQRLGPVAGKLHTARSRNDQVATDTRLYLRDAVDNLVQNIRALQSTLVELARRELHPEGGAMPTILPGTTHLQHAQPVLLSHHLLAYFWMLQRDRDRLSDCRRRTNLSPLGAGALAGTTFPIDRHQTSLELGFDGPIPNSMDAVADRDFILEFLAGAAITMVHLSRLAEEIILWNSPEFGFIELDDTVTTGSSIMPQKKNPDVAELTRGKVGRVCGHLVGMLTTMKALPLTYNKDMQEDKEALFDAVDTLGLVLPAVTLMLSTARFRRDRMRSATERDFSMATDLADWLSRRGMPFRDAHHLVGRIVSYCIQNSIALEDLDEAALRSFAPELEAEALSVLSVDAGVAARNVYGGTGLQAVERQLAEAEEALRA